MSEMDLFVSAFIFVVISLVASSPLEKDDVIAKYDDIRYQYVSDGKGVPRLVDLWAKTSDVIEAARYNPATDNVYHLFTRSNPSVSQPILLGADNLLLGSHFNPSKRTVFIIHGWTDSVSGDYVATMVPTFLAADDLNVIAVDWHAGGGTSNYIAAVLNCPISGRSVAEFINWVNGVTGASPGNYHLVGFSLGAHQVGIAARNVDGQIDYVTALDPAFPGWITNQHKFSPEDGLYTEVIHTNAGLLGYLPTLGQVDFYPNGGINMPGCNTPACDHDRAYFYLSESILRGGFTGVRCGSYLQAVTGACHLAETLNLGGLAPKNGRNGVFYLETDAAPPFSRG